ncbi:hypothetical protein EHQ58_09920 [Leptospira ognonensis]|uniref:Uncharacterized protein n=1 Tax=Leptospira ognonensis TaxID=2484945 RepID=A0A4R9K265_9LEPT|nr:hypothetical protein [Leptospira ognonensis]TGL59216.1 hypothetical protein EHQ58_09920 [Leptospira ognonensis]
MKLRYVLFSILLSNLIACNYYEKSIKGVTITGKEIKAEIRKSNQSLSGVAVGALNTLASVTGASTAITAKTCPSYTTDSAAPDFTLPGANSYSNVNLTGTLTAVTGTTTWTTTVQEPMIINALNTNTSVTCNYLVNLAGTTQITSSNSAGTTITISSALSRLDIVCTNFASTSAQTYTVSLNPRPTAGSSSAVSTLLSPETLLSDEIFANATKLQDNKVYQYDSFAECKKKYEIIAIAFASANAQIVQYYAMCGGYTAPAAQSYFQALSCNLHEANFIQTK